MEYKDLGEHIAALTGWLVENVRKKYLKGSIEHGDKLWRKPIIPEIIGEILDLSVYGFAIHEQLNEIKELAREGFEAHSDPTTPAEVYQTRCLLKIWNILEFGNKEGVKETGR
jgi:uncharacterized protein with ATP-grasp and redox domains